MPYETFGDVAALDTTSQRELLRRGGPLERIWAAWALGLHLGRTVAPDLLQGLQSSPDPGTRRHLIVMLAGLGERNVLIALADHDPDEFVRATACQYLGRVTLPGDAEAATLLRARLTEDRSLEVQQAILRLTLERLLPLSMAETTAHLQRPERTLRQLAIEILRATYPTDRLYPGPLETHLPEELEAEIRADLIAESMAADGGDHLLQLALYSNDDLRLEILHALFQAAQRFTWEHLAPLARLQHPISDAVLVDLLHPDDAGSALGWLLSCAARSLSWAPSQRRDERAIDGAVWHSGTKAQNLLPLAVATAPLLPLAPQQREDIGAIIAALERWEHLANLPDDDLDDDDFWPFDEEQLQLLNDLKLLQQSSSQSS
jgi:HEAT repeats